MPEEEMCGWCANNAQESFIVFGMGVNPVRIRLCGPCSREMFNLSDLRASNEISKEEHMSAIRSRTLRKEVLG